MTAAPSVLRRAPVRRTGLALLCLLLTALGAGGGDAGTIGWNYHRTQALGPGDVAGAPGFARDHWNNHAGVGQGPGAVPLALADSTGTPTTAEVSAWSVTSNNSWLHGQTANPDQLLMNDFNNRQPSVTFSGIPFGSYTVVVYYGNNEGPSASVLAVGPQSRAITTGDTTESSFGLKGYLEGTDANPAVPTNYAVFKGLVGANLTVSLSGDNNNGISAIQIVEGEAVPESTTPATPAFPLAGATGFKPWQPLCWNVGGAGETGYAVSLWIDGTPEPESPTTRVTGTTFTPESYLSENTSYRWRITTHLQSGGTLTSPDFAFTTGTLDGQPPFNISRSAQSARSRAIEARKGIANLVADVGGTLQVPEGTTLAFYGDSITDVFTYFDVLQAALQDARDANPDFPEVLVLNRGINGATSDDLLNLPDGDQFSGGSGPQPPLPFKRQVEADLAALAPDARYVAVLQIGINDVLQGDDTPKETFKARMEEMTDHVLAGGHSVVLVSPTAINESPIADSVTDGQFDDAGNSLLNQYADALKEIADTRGIPFVNQREAYLDIYRNENFAVARDAAGTVTYPRSTGFLNVDAVHPNPRGKALSSELAATGILQALRHPPNGRSSPPPPSPLEP